ncbi:relaxase/mobilization nuclease domain-containing protein [Bacteroides sp. L10-4]|uniref:conjugal transfer protein MobB n=1 Tax=Bacteroidales TaxID=171549 RepID=UPI001595CA0B|nr:MULTISPECIES: conjugal transfer protein MobB [Bacteroidales]NVK93439.1 relaxase/mobilization nuclease domain-containing protein [Bacteroides sp. L10-4]
MVAKISLGNSIYGALAYNAEKINKEKGRLLDTNKIYNDGSGSVNIHKAHEDFKRWMPTATRTEKPMVHISLNPHPDDHPTDAELTQIAREYMEKMGFGDMPFLIFKHEDIERHHVHIVALRVKTDGTCISDRNNFYRSKDICRELEKKYNLRPSEREKISPDTPIRKIDISGDMKRQVANTVKMVGMRYKFQTLGEFNAILSLYNVKAEQTDGRVNGREYHGLVYFATDDSGNVVASPFKASRLGKFASRTAIDNRFVRAKDRIDVNPTRTIVADALAQSSNKEEFIARLKAARIDVLFRYTEEGRIYGVTFIDHNTMTVLNGSRLGKDYSANAFERRFNGEQTQPDMPVVIPVTDTQTPDADTSTPNDTTSSAPEGTSQTQNPTPQPAEHHSDNDMPELPGLYLFHVGPGYDAQEDAFYRAMRRKKKKGRRPKL